MRGNQKLMKRKWETMKRTPKMTTATRKSPGMATVRRRRDIFACCGIKSSIICRMTSYQQSARTPLISSPLPTLDRLSRFAKKDKGGGIRLERGPGSLYKCRRGVVLPSEISDRQSFHLSGPINGFKPVRISAI